MRPGDGNRRCRRLLPRISYSPARREAAKRRVERRFGDKYLRYKQHVPRWIPRLRPWRDRTGRGRNHATGRTFTSCVRQEVCRRSRRCRMGGLTNRQMARVRWSGAVVLESIDSSRSFGQPAPAVVAELRTVVIRLLARRTNPRHRCPALVAELRLTIVEMMALGARSGLFGAGPSFGQAG